MVLIYRYSNRKLYNTEAKRYITLNGVLDLLNEGKAIKVINRVTKSSPKEPFKDITVDTVTKAFFQAGLFHNTVKDFLELRKEIKEVKEVKVGEV